MIVEVKLGLIVRQSAERAEVGLLCLHFEQQIGALHVQLVGENVHRGYGGQNNECLADRLGALSTDVVFAEVKQAQAAGLTLAERSHQRGCAFILDLIGAQPEHMGKRLNE